MRKIGGVQRSILEADMKYLIVLLWAMALPVLAQTAAPQSEEDWERARTQAEAMRAQADLMRSDAEKADIEAQRSCWQKFLVSSCLEDSKNTRRIIERDAKRIDVEAGRIERSIKVHERELKAQRRIDEAPQREADVARRTEEIRLKEAAALERMEKKQTKNRLN